MRQIVPGPYSALFRRLRGVHDLGPTTLSEEFIPVLELGNPPLEWSALLNWREVGVGFELPASALLPSTVRLVNPATSGILALVELVTWVTDGTNNLVMAVHNTLTTLAVASSRGFSVDGRLGLEATSYSACLGSTGNVAPETGRFYRMVGTANVPRDERQVCLLPPGTALDMGTIGDNVLLRVNLRWRERYAYLDELRLE